MFKSSAAITMFFGILIAISCKLPEKDKLTISKSEMTKIASDGDKQFSIGVKNKDSALLANIYSDSAQYVQPGKPIMKGKAAIGKDWAEFLRLPQHPIDLVLIINEVRGTRDIIYETGDGYTLLEDASKWTFHYVNVWRLQPDGIYKLDIDTYNPKE